MIHSATGFGTDRIIVLNEKKKKGKGGKSNSSSEVTATASFGLNDQKKKKPLGKRGGKKKGKKKDIEASQKNQEKDQSRETETLFTFLSNTKSKDIVTLDDISSNEDEMESLEGSEKTNELQDDLEDVLTGAQYFFNGGQAHFHIESLNPKYFCKNCGGTRQE